MIQHTLSAIQSTTKALQVTPVRSRIYKSIRSKLRKLINTLEKALKRLLTAIPGKNAPKPRRKRRRRRLPPVTLTAHRRKPDHQEAIRCRALLLEIVRRATYDWVLYRMSRKLHHKRLAKDAYIWLFLESGGTHKKERSQSGKSLTGFLPICELLDLDPGTVRQRARKLTIKSILNMGRPPENRKVAGAADIVELPIHCGVPGQ
jgi:hypothetical protein